MFLQNLCCTSTLLFKHMWFQLSLQHLAANVGELREDHFLLWSRNSMFWTRAAASLTLCIFVIFSLYFCCVFIFLYLVLVAQFDVLDASRLVSDTVHFCIQFFLYFIFFVLYFYIFVFSIFFCIHLVLVAQFDVSDANRLVSDTDRAAPGFKPQIMIQSRQAACQMLHNQQTFCFIQIHTRRCPFGRPQISFQSPHGKTFKK